MANSEVVTRAEAAEKAAMRVAQLAEAVVRVRMAAEQLQEREQALAGA